MRSARWNRMMVVGISSVTLAACAEPSADGLPLTVAMPLHLERHLETATLVGSEVPANAAEAMEWQLDRPQTDWQPAIPWSPTIDPVELTQLDDALRVRGRPHGGPRQGRGVLREQGGVGYDTDTGAARGRGRGLRARLQQLFVDAPSTASFMTSLQTSVTGGLPGGSNPLPAEAVTMAEHMHRAGYQTAAFTGNPNAGTLSELQRGVDLFREDWEDFSYFGGNNHRESSTYLHEGFWEWREAYPSQPFWAHFQTTDTHEDFPTVAPFAGRFVSPVERETWREWDERLGEAGGHGIYSEAFDSTGISRTEFFTLHQGLYDEAMAHNDYQLGRLVDRLKAEGTWDKTLLIIGGDHSTEAAMDDMVVLLDSLPPRWGHPIFRPTVRRIPLIFVWPGRIPGGQRFDEPVSMIDVLPTLLGRLGLPPAEIAQGQSLAPLMLGQDGWEPRPVIFDEFYAGVGSDPTQLSGRIEVLDGRWGASLLMNPMPHLTEPDRRPSPLLLYDLWNDPWAVRSVHQERPGLVEKYTAFLVPSFRRIWTSRSSSRGPETSSSPRSSSRRSGRWGTSGDGRRRQPARGRPRPVQISARRSSLAYLQ